MSDEEWAPWIEHDGKGCPCRGMMVESEERGGLVEQHIAGAVNPDAGWSCWEWATCPNPEWQIIRYRIRKPKALRELIDMVENLPQPEQVTA